MEGLRREKISTPAAMFSTEQAVMMARMAHLNTGSAGSMAPIAFIRGMPCASSNIGRTQSRWMPRNMSQALSAPESASGSTGRGDAF
ncbi:hypothetical protein D3C85_1562310 [compost metagenome]